MRWSSYFKLFKREYLFDKNVKHHLVLALGFGLWIFLLLWFAEPFEIYRFSVREKIKLLPVYAILGAITYCICLPYQIWVFHKTKKWVLYNEVVLVAITSTLASFIIYIFYYVAVDHYNNAYPFFKYVRLIFAPSLVVILPFLIIGRISLGKSNGNPPHKLYEKREVQKSGQNNYDFHAEDDEEVIYKKITIKGIGYRDFITLNLNDLAFINSVGNYAEVHFVEDGILRKKILRAKLLEVETKVPQLYRTHRSYLINPYFFKGFIKQKTNLFIDLGFETKIPVARNIKTKAQRDLPFKTKR